MMTAKNRVTVNLNDEEYTALQQLALDEDRSMAWLGRQAMQSYLEKFGLYKSSAKADNILETVGQTR